MHQREGFDGFCLNCLYASYINKASGKCLCKRTNVVIFKKRFPPSMAFSEIPGRCNLFRLKTHTE
jgi:hypothetical protein